jgi:hypothetical protein
MAQVSPNPVDVHPQNACLRWHDAHADRRTHFDMRKGAAQWWRVSSGRTPTAPEVE